MSMLILIRNIEEMGTALEAANKWVGTWARVYCAETTLCSPKKVIASRVQSHAGL